MLSRAVSERATRRGTAPERASSQCAGPSWLEPEEPASGTMCGSLTRGCATGSQCAKHGERPEMRVRFRTLGCYPLTGTIEFGAANACRDRRRIARHAAVGATRLTDR